MKAILISYVASLVPLLILDGIWLSLTLREFYSTRLGTVVAFDPKLLPGAVFYLIYALGIAIVLVGPALEANTAYPRIFLLGALVGLMAYGAYDLTNQATIAGWPVSVTLVDMAWGAFVTGSTATIAQWVARLYA